MGVLSYPVNAWHIVLGNIAGSKIHPTEASFDAAQPVIERAATELRKMLPALRENIHTTVIEDSSSPMYPSEKTHSLHISVDCRGLPKCEKSSYAKKLSDLTGLKTSKDQSANSDVIVLNGPEIARFYQCDEFRLNFFTIRDNEKAVGKYDKILKTTSSNMAEIGETLREIKEKTKGNELTQSESERLSEHVREGRSVTVGGRTYHHNGSAVSIEETRKVCSPER